MGRGATVRGITNESDRAMKQQQTNLEGFISALQLLCQKQRTMSEAHRLKLGEFIQGCYVPTCPWGDWHGCVASACPGSLWATFACRTHTLERLLLSTTFPATAKHLLEAEADAKRKGLKGAV